LEDEAGAGAEQPAELLLAALGALGQGRLGERLELLELMLTVVAAVIVGWHGLFSPGKSLGFIRPWPAAWIPPPSPVAGRGRGACNLARPLRSRCWPACPRSETPRGP